MTKDSELPKQSKPKASRKQVNVDDMLVKGEEIVERAEIHWGIYWKSIAVFIFAVLVAVFVVFEIGVLLAISAFVMFIYATLKKQILMLALTNKRMLFRYGIMQIDVVDMRFSKIESIEIERMPPGYIMGYSNVVIMGTGQRYVVIPYVANGLEIRQAYNHMTLSEEELEDE